LGARELITAFLLPQLTDRTVIPTLPVSTFLPIYETRSLLRQRQSLRLLPHPAGLTTKSPLRDEADPVIPTAALIPAVATMTVVTIAVMTVAIVANAPLRGATLVGATTHPLVTPEAEVTSTTLL